MGGRAQEPVRESLREYGRGIAGGLLFSLPLLYTMEVWWAGFLLDSRRLLICFVTTFLLLLAYNRFSGIHPGFRLLDVVIDSVEEFGIGIVLAALVLFLLGRIAPGMPREEILGKIILESMLVSIGVSVGTAQLGMSQNDVNDDSAGSDEETTGGDSQKSTAGEEGERTGESAGPRGSDTLSRPPIGKQGALSVCGAVLFAANIAPTEEIVVIATESAPWRLLAIVGLSLAMGALILYFSEFHQAHRMYPPAGWLLGMFDVAFTYAIGLFASAMILWLFQRFEGVSVATGVAEVVVLGFAGNLGASAGRLLIE